jgi:FtsP/CotA-like multicopper oxidase with cupredoxin domain
MLFPLVRRAGVGIGFALAITLVFVTLSARTQAQPVPGGTLDPLTIPKYVTPLVIPPVMKDSAGDNSTSDYDIAVRQFQQQILPGGHWNALSPTCSADPGLCSLPATTVWSYGPAADPLPDSSGIPGGAEGLAPAPNSQFNYPAYTFENEVNSPTAVNWINDLKENFGAGPDYLQHLLPIDQTLHWANPGTDCIMGDPRTDCRGNSQEIYDGPVPIVVHVHGAHVGPESDGYPEAWWLPAPLDDSNFECVEDPADADNLTKFVCQGTLANGYGYGDNTNVTPGVANFSYPNDQPSTTLWYHDHALGMTRNNVYAGPAGFWLIRENGGGETGLISGTLPGPAPVAGEGLAETNLAPGRFKYREIPIVIQDRSFNDDGSLFYPANRAVFEGLLDSQGGNIPSVLGNTDAGLLIDFIPDSDIAPVWNPEAFFNVMVVNGVSWPELEVAPAIYRFRLLNGCNSRFLNLSMGLVNGQGTVLREIPFYQIGAEQSLLPKVVRIETGYATPLPGDGSDVNPRRPDCLLPNGKVQSGCVPAAPAPFTEQALLMALAERADVLVDFRGLKDGDVVRMSNTAADAPFGGFPDVPADPSTTGQVMQFRVNKKLLRESPTDPKGAAPATDPWRVMLSPVENVDTYPGDSVMDTRDLALIEEESETVCVLADEDEEFVVPIVQVPCDMEPPEGETVVPFGPKAAVLGIHGSKGGTVTLWNDFIETNPQLNATETWELYNFTADAHPIHLHLVKFKVLDRQLINDTGDLVDDPVPPEADETGWKDTVIAYPGQVTRVTATFDIAGLYVWHCHIVEHEDNEMMVPYCVGNPELNGCDGLVRPTR